jgi:hypothetical protein
MLHVGQLPRIKYSNSVNERLCGWTGIVIIKSVKMLQKFRNGSLAYVE